MEGSVENTGNQTTPDGTAGNETASGTTIENIMGNMAGDAEAKPGTANPGEKAETAPESQQPKSEAPAWTSQLSEEIRNNEAAMKQLAKFNKLSDLAKSYSELESKLGKSIVKPGEEASAEEKEAYYRALGKPETEEGYSIEGDNSALFKKIAYKNNLTDDQAKSLFSTFIDVGKNAIAQQQAAKAANAKATDQALRQEWGKDYDVKVKMLQRGVNAYGGKALGEKLQASGLLFDADVVKMFVKLGEMNQEPGAAGKTAAGGPDYVSTADGGQFSWVKNLNKK